MSAQRKYHVAIALVHHSRKNTDGLRPGMALRGSSDFHAWVDVGLYLQRTNQQLLLTVEHRSAPSIEALPIELVTEQDRCPYLRLANGEGQPEQTSLEQRVLRTLQQAPEPLSLRTLRRSVQARNQDVAHTLKSLHEQGRLEQTRRGWTLPTNTAVNLTASPQQTDIF